MKSMIFLLCAVLILGSSCENDKDPKESKTFLYEFSGGTDGWSGDFADYPITDSVFYELAVGYAQLPPPLNTSKGAMKISGNNHSDDLFMFIKRKITGLEPNTSYSIKFDIEFASSAPTNAIGVGGPPGEAVSLGVGATRIEPKKVADGGSYAMNIDKINQSNSGDDMIKIGHVGVSDTTTVFTLIKRSNNMYPFSATTDNSGNIWVIIGTDSGFEATTTLYYSKISMVFIKED